MTLVQFLAESILISLSGVLAPGPMTAVTVGKGSETPHAGALIAVGHGIVEIPLMIAIFYGLGKLMSSGYVKTAVGIMGGVFLFYMAFGMVRSIGKPGFTGTTTTHSPVIDGLLLSIGNPYFIIWWAVVGAALIIQSIQFGPKGFVAFAAVHWTCDFIWCYFLSAVSYKGGRVLGRRFQQVVLIICSIMLVFFGGRFLLEGINTLITMV